MKYHVKRPSQPYRSIQNKDIHPFSQKDKSVLLPYYQNQVKLFHMLQNEQTNYP